MKKQKEQFCNIGRLFTIVVAAWLLCMTSVVTAKAETKTGTAENGLTYSFDTETGELVYSGSDSGYHSGNPLPNSIAKSTVSVSFKDCKLTSAQDLFLKMNKLESINLEGLDTSGMTTMSGMFSGCSSLKTVDLSKLDTSNVTNMGSMFSDCNSLTTLDLSGFDTSKVTHMYSMFSGCSSLTTLDLSGFDTSNVTYMYSMFSGCSSLKSLDLSSFDTSNVTYMSSMFSGCSNLKTLSLRNLDTFCVESMNSMFSGCDSLTTLDLSGFDTSNVTDMGSIFSDCSSLTSLDLSGFNTSNVTDMGSMFSGCSSLTSLDLSGFDTSRVIYMYSMFSDCGSLTSLDLSGIDTSRVIYMHSMFSDCDSLQTIKTFKAMPESLSVYLPDSFTDEDGNVIDEITSAYVGKTLTRVAESSSNTSTDNNDSADTTEQVEAFVERMYTKALNRDAEEDGLNDWTTQLLNHTIDGAGIAHGFIDSAEMANRNLSDSDYVDMLYRTFFDREPDDGGKQYWLNALSSGSSREYVLHGFVMGEEFENLCDSYGIVCGIMREDGSVVNPGIRQFVERCYTKVLGRDAEKEGAEDWTSKIANGEWAAADVAKTGFLCSAEYLNKNTDDSTFVETLYETFMDRASDEGGKSYWLDKLQNGGYTREQVIAGFADSTEFANILASYGL